MARKPDLTRALPHPVAKAAIDALQSGDSSAWSRLFEPGAKLYDDGTPCSLQKFTREALGHERFTAIEQVENGGLDLVGTIHSDAWGEFRSCFRFRPSAAGKIARLDIGQAD